MKAFTVHSKANIYFYASPVNMSCMFDGLQKLVKEQMKEKPLSGDVFMFSNKRGDYVKILWYAHHGFNVFAKRLDAHCSYSLPLQGKLTKEAMARVIDNVVVAGKTKIKRVA